MQILSVALCLIALIYLLADGEDFKHALGFIVVLLVASIPIAIEIVRCDSPASHHLLCSLLQPEGFLSTRANPDRTCKYNHVSCVCCREVISTTLVACKFNERHLRCSVTCSTTTLALGSRQLAQQGAIVTRLTAIEEMAGMTLLCSDKTGTLTLNTMVIQVPSHLPSHPVLRGRPLGHSILAR